MIKLPSGLNINDLVNDLRTFSWEAADALLHYSKVLKDSKYKSNILKNENKDNPVTLADLKVNDIIIQRINDKYRDIDWEILSEENIKIDSKCCDTSSDWLWVLDPLDGTKDFLQGTSNYAMHLALNFRQKPYLGVVLIPENDELWIADGQKVWCENRDGLKTKPEISKKNLLSEMILVTSKNHRNQNLKNLIQKIQFNEIRVMGSIGCKIASIIKGESDIYICMSLPGQSSPMDWDFAAPEVILKAAGGRITNLDNIDLSYGDLDLQQKGIIVATSCSETHEKVCFEIKEVIEKYNIYPIRP